MSAATTTPKKPSPKAKGASRCSPKRESKFAKATTCDFDGYIGCYLCQPDTPSSKEAKKNGERTTWSERICKWLLNNQLEVGESDNEDEDPTFADPNHLAENNKEEEAETAEATTT